MQITSRIVSECKTANFSFSNVFKTCSLSKFYAARSFKIYNLGTIVGVGLTVFTISGTSCPSYFICKMISTFQTLPINSAQFSKQHIILVFQYMNVINYGSYCASYEIVITTSFIVIGIFKLGTNYH